MREFFELNEPLLYFTYGQIWFVLGLSILLRSRPRSRLELAYSLPLLGAFGLTQALSEWGYLFIPIQATFTSSALVAVLRVIHLFIQALAGALLLTFGLQVLSFRLGSEVGLRLPLGLYGLWGFVVFVAWVFDLAPVTDIQASARAASRYMLMFPGATLAAWGLYRQIQRAADFISLTQMATYLRVASLTLAIYALLAGILVPEAPFFPADTLNEDLLNRALGVPAALFQAALGVVLVYVIWHALRIFQAEADQWIEQMERDQALAADRARIGRELHDGTIQSIYAAGLILEDARQALDVAPERARTQLSRAMDNLNRTIQDIRSYIFDLKQEKVTDSLEVSISQLVRDFRVNTLIEVDLCIEGKHSSLLEPERAQHLYQIAREALTNVARHAQARHVEMRLTFGEHQCTLRVADDGIGFLPSGVDGSGRGLRNMRERAQLLDGALVVEGQPNIGVTVVLTVPYEAMT